MGDPTIEDLLEEYAWMTMSLQPLIQAQQAALDIAMTPLNNLKEQIIQMVIERGESIDTPVARATYRSPSTRTSWDNQALVGYMAAHPELQQFQKVSPVSPSVSIKLV